MKALGLLVIISVIEMRFVISFGIDNLAPIFENLIKKRADIMVESKLILKYLNKA